MDAEQPAARVFLQDRGDDAVHLRYDIDTRAGAAMIHGRKNRRGTDILANGYVSALRNHFEPYLGRFKDW